MIETYHILGSSSPAVDTSGTVEDQVKVADFHDDVLSSCHVGVVGKASHLHHGVLEGVDFNRLVFEPSQSPNVSAVETLGWTELRESALLSVIDKRKRAIASQGQCQSEETERQEETMHDLHIP